MNPLPRRGFASFTGHWDTARMDVWEARSSAVRQVTAAACCAVVGAVLAWGFRGFPSVRSDAFAGFALGILLLGIGIAGVLATGRQVVRVDGCTRIIQVADTSLLHRSTRDIPFDDVVDARIGYFGKRSNFVNWYYVVLQLRDGEHYALFGPGRFFDGGSSRRAAQARLQALHDRGVARA